MHKLALGALGSALLLVLCVWLLGGDASRTRAERLTLFCAAGLRAPVVAIVDDYEREAGVRVDVQYGGSGTLLSQLAVARAGDLYLAGDAGYVERARERGLVAEVIDVASMRPVLGVRAGNPLGIRGLDDLTRDGVRLGLANPDAAAVGEVARDVLRTRGLWDSLAQRASVFKPTVSELANDLVIGTIDAAVIWDATANQYPDIDAVPDPVLEPARRDVTLGVLTESADPTAALKFARFLTSRDRGLPHFATAGFRVVDDGDPWADAPELVLFSGAMLRAAIEDTIAEFAEREGVAITRVYNGCGILVAQMRSGRPADAYFSCDTAFLDMVGDRFEPGEPFAQNDLVLCVPKGNPRGVAGLEDLTTAGLRVGLGHPESSALGALTQTVLDEAGLLDSLRGSGNVVVTSPTGDLLVAQSLAGSLDAAIVYRSNAAAALAELEVVPIDRPAAHATQPFAIGKDTRYPRLLERLRRRLADAASRERFERLGFRWRFSGTDD